MRSFQIGLVFLIGMLGSATADPYGRRGPPVRVDWDSRGWTLLGERTVDGRVDRDRIDVGRYEGKFSKLTLVVHDSDLELLDFAIEFADRTKYEPRLGHYFKEGQRTRAFDLPTSENVIRHIDIKYRNLPGGGRARVQVWGFRIEAPPPPRVEWDSRGWTLLGERTVDGRVDYDRIDMNRRDGRYTKLTLVALDSDLQLIDFRVTFADGEEWRPGLRHHFRENQRSHAIDFPGDKRFIKHIDFKYANLPGGGRARFQVWGLKAAEPTPYSWDSRGWQMLGEQTVDGRIDRDRIVVGRDEGRFSKLMIVVLDSDLELLDFDVKFARGAAWNPAVHQVFRENTRTRAIDLPGDRRVIKHIDLKYANLPGGGRARIQIWGK